MARRGARAAEYVQVLRALWTGKVAAYDGEFYHVPAGTQAPAPVQPGGPPILLGGMAKPALERIGRIAEGWITSSRTDLSRVGDLISVVKESAAAAGRDPEAMRFICRGVVRAGEPVTAANGERLLLSGDYDQIRADTEWLGSRGVTEVFYDLNWDPQIGSPDVPGGASRRQGRGDPARARAGVTTASRENCGTGGRRYGSCRQARLPSPAQGRIGERWRLVAAVGRVQVRTRRHDLVDPVEQLARQPFDRCSELALKVLHGAGSDDRGRHRGMAHDEAERQLDERHPRLCGQVGQPVGRLQLEPVPWQAHVEAVRQALRTPANRQVRIQAGTGPTASRRPAGPS